MTDPTCPACSGPIDAQTGICPNCATSVQPVSAAPHVPGFRMLRELGTGGMGTVYLGEESALSRRVAIKFMSARLSADVQARSRFLREARSMATVEHPHVVRVYSYGEIEGNAYLVMEYVEGETLTDRIARLGALPVNDAVQITRQVVEALEAAWERGIIHRDIKPSNVLLDRRGRVRVADFGLAKPVHLDRAVDTSLTQSGYMLGSPHYVSPEQAQGQDVDFRADLYSLGIMLYQMLTGQRPYEATTPVAIVAKHLHEPLPSIRQKRPDVPVEVERLVQWLAAKEPGSRPESYAKLLQALDALQPVTPGRPVPTFPSIAIGTPTEKWWAADLGAMPVRTRLAAAGGVLAIGIVLFIALAILGSKRARVTPPAPPRETRLVVAVAPFYGPDEDSAKEGRLMAGLIERAIQQRLGRANARVIGIDETRTPLRDHDAARALGTRLKANAVIWGEAFALRGETEIEPHITVIRESQETTGTTSGTTGDQRLLTAKGDPLTAIEERGGGTVKLEAQAPNQIELRKTSASGIGDVVILLAAIHALDTQHQPQKALQLFGDLPRTAETLRYQANSLLQLGRNDEAQAKLEESLTLEPAHAQTLATLGDLHLAAGREDAAISSYQRAGATGQPYISSSGFMHGGLLYRKDTYRSQYYGGAEKETLYLLGIDPQSKRVRVRYTLSGIPNRFERTGDAVNIQYRLFKDDNPETATVTMRNGSLDRPLWPSVNLLWRVRSLKAGRALAANFLSELDSVRDPNSKTTAKFELGKTVHPDAPDTLPELEKQLRAASDRDPTQPWHLFLLAITIDAAGRPDEAEAVLREMLRRDYPGTHYYEFAWMMGMTERMRRQAWTDLIFPKALEARRRIPQPVAGATLIERLINAPFARQAAMNRDLRYSHRRLVQARQLAGLAIELEDLGAAAWARYFTSTQPDPARAEAERRVLRTMRATPMNFIRWTVLADYGLAASTAALTVFCFVVVGLLIRGVGRVRRSNRIGRSLTEVMRKALSRLPPAWRAVVAAIIVTGALVGLAYFFVLQLYHNEFFFISLVLVMIAVGIRARNVRLADLAAALQRRERFVLATAYVISIASIVWLSVSVATIGMLAATPIGWADSAGHGVIVSDLEKRLSDGAPSPPLLFAAAVVNHYAGNRERARDLYGKVSADPRSQKNLEALQQGRMPAVSLSLDDLYRAYMNAPMGSRILGVVTELGRGHFDATLSGGVLLGFLVIVICTIPLVLLLAVRPDPTLRASDEPDRPASVPLRALMLVVPGLYDLRRGNIWRAALIAFGIGLAIVPVLTYLLTKTPSYAPGPRSSLALPNYVNTLPLPFTASEPVQVYVRPVFRLAYPGAALFYAIVMIAAATAVVLHVWRIPAILRREAVSE